MTIEFTLNPKSPAEAGMIKSFCEYIIKNIRYDIYKRIDIQKYERYEEILLNASWIIWIVKPKSINIAEWLKLIIRNVIYKQRTDGLYCIYIKNINIPNTVTKLDALVRFLDKGNEMSPPTYFMTKIFQEYKDNLNDYWVDYCIAKTGVTPKSQIEMR